MIRVDVLSPWPAMHGPIVVHWQRGQKRKGSTVGGATHPDDEEGPTTYRFVDTVFEVPATLYEKEDGTYEGKIVDILMSQVDHAEKPANLVGVVQVDLAQLVHLRGEPARQEFEVECSETVVNMAGGRPKLVLELSVLEREKKRGMDAVHPDDETVVLSTGGDGDGMVGRDTSVKDCSAEGRNVSGKEGIGSPHAYKKNTLQEHTEEFFDSDGFLIDEEGDEDEKGMHSEQKWSENGGEDAILVPYASSLASRKEPWEMPVGEVLDEEAEAVKKNLQVEMEYEGSNAPMAALDSIQQSMSLDTSPFQASQQKYVLLSCFYLVTQRTTLGV